jgi:CDP-glucose 4,6-dehydratase
MGVGERPVEDVGVDPVFWHGRRVLVTGHTGFKGTWLALWLRRMGAEVVGLSEGVPTRPSLYELAQASDGLVEVWGDVRDVDAVRAAFDHEPEVVIHMAAQAFVRRSFRDPRTTYETNVMGTVNVLEAVRASSSVRAVVNVTSDKCYDNHEQGRPFSELDPKGGHDPYSNSKGCAELVADAYLRSFFAPSPDGPRLGSARAGNVIGGGDWGEDRLIPDVMRAVLEGTTVSVRHPGAIRPWQHVLNPLSGYLELAQALVASPGYQGGWNFGPGADDIRPVGWLLERLEDLWDGELHWHTETGVQLHEAQLLSLDSSKAREQLGWRPRWDLLAALDSIVDWYRTLCDGGTMRDATDAQIGAFQVGPLAVAA